MRSAIVRIDESRVEVELIDLVKIRPEALGWHFRRLQEFVAGFKNRAWHIKKVKREYGNTKISVFHRFFRDGVCPAGAISKTTPIDQ